MQKDVEYLFPSNHGSHLYPGLGHDTATCKYCGGLPDGSSPDCPGNPTLRDAYEVLLAARDNPGKD